MYKLGHSVALEKAFKKAKPSTLILPQGPLIDFIGMGDELLTTDGSSSSSSSGG